MSEEFEQAAATAEMPAEEEHKTGYDVDLDYNMEWEVETEPAQPDAAAPQQGPQYEQHSGGQTSVYRQFNKHLFVWLFSFLFGMYGLDRSRSESRSFCHSADSGYGIWPISSSRSSRHIPEST